MPQRHRHLHPQLTRLRPQRQILPTRLRGNREPRRHRQTQPSHLRKIRPLTTQQILLILITLSEIENKLRHNNSSFTSRTRSRAREFFCTAGARARERETRAALLRHCELISLERPCGGGPSGLKMVVRSPADVVLPWSFEAVH